MMGLSDESLLLEFVTESKEHLSSIEPDLLVLEREGKNAEQEIINRIFRAIHSIKGAAGFFGLQALKNLSHTMESVFMLIRDGELEPTPEMMDPLLGGIDKLNQMLDNIHQSEFVDCQAETLQLNKILGIEPQPSPSSDVGPQTELPVASSIGFDVEAGMVQEALKRGKQLFSIEVILDKDLVQQERSPLDFLKEVMSIGDVLDTAFNVNDFPSLENCLDASLSLSILFASVLDADLVASALNIDLPQVQLFAPETLLAATPESQTETATVPEVDNTVPVQPTAAQVEAVSPITALPDAPKGVESVASDESKTKQPVAASESVESIRVRVELLNKLMDLAGEMVLSRNQLLRSMGKELTHRNGLMNIIQNIDLITSDLQEHIMQTRMQPIGSIFGKFPRITRDMSRQLGKKIELQTLGEEVELDKTILESLSDPLTHLIRNCCDHAIELPEDRQQAGKPETGTICLRAYHEGGQINIAITDDGRGIDHEKIAAKAIANGLISEESVKKMSLQERVHLIFLPGLSTAEKVSDISGRGVGMDVVKTNIEKIGGHISIDTSLGEGTTILLRLPLTLAIIPSLVVGVAGQRFAIPQVNLVELVCVRAAEITRRIEKVGSAAVLQLRGKLLPLVRLADVLNLDRMFLDPKTMTYKPDRRLEIADVRVSPSEDLLSTDNARNNQASDYNILVLKVGGNQFGLIVDELLDMEEIVVKPLSTFIKDCRCYAGATIMGDGRVALILDAAGILTASQLSFTEISTEQRRLDLANRSLDSDTDKQAIILFNVAPDERFALPLDSILRLEKIRLDQVERLGEREFITHGDKSIHILHLPRYLPITDYPLGMKEGFLIIPKAGQGKVGLMASQILDTMEAQIALEHGTFQEKGVLGSLVLEEHLTAFLDPEQLIEQAGVLVTGGQYAN